MQTFHLKICDLRVKASWQSRSEFTVSVPFHCYPLVVPNSPRLCLPIFFFSFPFLHFPSQLSWHQPQRTGSFCLFDASQSNNETSQTPKLDTIRRGARHVGGCSVRETLLTHDNRSTHAVTSPLFSKLASLPNHSVRCRPLLSVFNYGMLCRAETIQEHCNLTQPTIF